MDAKGSAHCSGVQNSKAYDLGSMDIDESFTAMSAYMPSQRLGPPSKPNECLYLREIKVQRELICKLRKLLRAANKGYNDKYMEPDKLQRELQKCKSDFAMKEAALQKEIQRLRKCLLDKPRTDDRLNQSEQKQRQMQDLEQGIRDTKLELFSVEMEKLKQDLMLIDKQRCDLQLQNEKLKQQLALAQQQRQSPSVKPKCQGAPKISGKSRLQHNVPQQAQAPSLRDARNCLGKFLLRMEKSSENSVRSPSFCGMKRLAHKVEALADKLLTNAEVCRRRDSVQTGKCRKS